MAARVAAALAIAFLATACMGGDDPPSTYTENDLPSIVRGALDAPDGWALDEELSGSVTEERWAASARDLREAGIDPDDPDPALVRELGFIAGRNAHFSDASSARGAALESAYVFEDAEGAAAVLRLGEEWLDGRVSSGDSETVGAPDLGDEAYGFEHGGGENGLGFSWRRDNLVLSVIGVGVVDQRALAEALDDRAEKAAR